MITSRERQGPGWARWYDSEEEAAAYAAEKREKGHIVRHDEDAPLYVWVSYSRKKHGTRVRLVEAGYDTLSV